MSDEHACINTCLVPDVGYDVSHAAVDGSGRILNLQQQESCMHTIHQRSIETEPYACVCDCCSAPSLCLCLCLCLSLDGSFHQTHRRLEAAIPPHNHHREWSIRMWICHVQNITVREQASGMHAKGVCMGSSCHGMSEDVIMRCDAMRCDTIRYDVMRCERCDVMSCDVM